VLRLLKKGMKAMSYYDYNYANQAVKTANSTLIWIIVSLVIAIIGGIALYLTVFDKKNDNKYKGFMGKLYDFFNFKTFILNDLFRVIYLMSTIAVTLLSFSYISTSFWLFLATLVLGNLGLRITFELLMLSLELFKNVKEINSKLKK
jgi:hypothetical protein